MTTTTETFVSPLAPDSFPAMPAIEGVELGAVAANLEYKNRLDLLLIHIPGGASVAGLFTQNQIKAAPVIWSMDNLGRSPENIHGIVVNAGQRQCLLWCERCIGSKKGCQFGCRKFELPAR